MQVRIVKPCKNAMQSGRAGMAKFWVIQPVLESARQPEDLMGWTSCGDTLSGFKLKFKKYEDAVKFAEAKGWDVEVVPLHDRQVMPQSYMDNFTKRALSSVG